MGRSNFVEISHPKKRAFLAAYAATGVLATAAEIAHCEIHSHYYWLKDDTYKTAFALAREMAADLHEDEASRRALGWDEEHTAADGRTYTVRKYSDTMLIVRLKALKPDDYRERTSIEHSGPKGAPIQLEAMAPDQRKARIVHLLAQHAPKEIPADVGD